MLRERGLVDEAEQLRAGQLASMVAAVRTPQDTDETIEQKLAALFATETERVANAAVLAEMLAPLLTDSRAMPLPLAAVNSAAPFPAAVVAPGSSPAPFPPASPAPAAAPAARPARVAGTLDLAGFIDEMIAQERAS